MQERIEQERNVAGLANTIQRQFKFYSNLNVKVPL